MTMWSGCSSTTTSANRSRRHLNARWQSSHSPVQERCHGDSAELSRGEVSLAKCLKLTGDDRACPRRESRGAHTRGRPARLVLRDGRYSNVPVPRRRLVAVRAGFDMSQTTTHDTERDSEDGRIERESSPSCGYVGVMRLCHAARGNAVEPEVTA